MNNKTTLLISLLLTLLSACTTPKPQPGLTTSTGVDSEPADISLSKSKTPKGLAMTKEKSGEILELVRIMEGGACKNEKSGAIASFMLYANSDDLKRLKQNQGTEVFADFEQTINDFSMLALQQALEKLDFEAGANSETEDTRLQQLQEELSVLFIDNIADNIVKFENDSSLMIDVIPNAWSLYLDGCEIPHEH